MIAHAQTPPRPATPRSLLRAASWSIALPVALGVLASLPALANGALFDDELLIFSNPYAQSLRYVRENLTRDFFYSAAGRPIGYYRPATKLLFMLEYQLWAARPLGYHALSVALFALTVAAGFRLARSAGLPLRAACVGACLYASHPAAARTVSTIASQADLGVVLGMLASAHAYLSFRRAGRRALLWLALTTELLALAFKETAVVIPALWLLIELDRGRLSLRSPVWLSLVPLLSYAALRAGLGILPIAAGHAGLLGASSASAKLLVATALRSLVPLRFISQLYTARPDADLGALLAWGIPACALLAGSLAAFVRVPALRLWLGLLWLPAAPFVLGGSAVHISDDPRALVLSDRWLLLPALAGSMLLAYAFELGMSQLQRSALRACAWIGVCALCGVQTLVAADENASYQSENARALHSAALYAEHGATPPDAPDVQLAAAAIRAELHGDLAGAVRAHAALLARDPSDSMRHYNLANALYRAGSPQLALREALLAMYGRAPDSSLQLPANDSFTRRRPEKALLLGLIYEALGAPDQARRYYEMCLALNPDERLARQHLTALTRAD